MGCCKLCAAAKNHARNQKHVRRAIGRTCAAKHRACGQCTGAAAGATTTRDLPSGEQRRGTTDLPFIHGGWQRAHRVHVSAADVAITSGMCGYQRLQYVRVGRTTAMHLRTTSAAHAVAGAALAAGHALAAGAAGAAGAALAAGAAGAVAAALHLDAPVVPGMWGVRLLRFSSDLKFQLRISTGELHRLLAICALFLSTCTPAAPTVSITARLQHSASGVPGLCVVRQRLRLGSDCCYHRAFVLQRVLIVLALHVSSRVLAHAITTRTLHDATATATRQLHAADVPQ